MSNSIKKAVLSQGEPRDAAVKIDTYIEFYNKSIMERLCTLNRATLSTRTHLAPMAKASTKHLELRLDVIQRHTFWDH